MRNVGYFDNLILFICDVVRVGEEGRREESCLVICIKSFYLGIRIKLI